MLKEEYEAWRLKARAEAFNTALKAHATASRPTGYSLSEYLSLSIAVFDKQFPKESPNAR